MHVNVTGTLVATWDDVERTPGAFMFDVGQRSLIYNCPCGCEAIGALPIYPTGQTVEPAQRPAWGWDGQQERPTLTPSIRKLSGCFWHGHLVAGEWQPCSDSGHR